MRNVILLIGIPGSGKTIIGKKLSQNFKGLFIDIPILVKKKKLFSYYDKEYRSYVVDTKKLRKELNKIYNIKDKKIIISSHFPIYVPKKKILKVIVLRCNPLILIKRLKKRKYPHEKIKDNVISELIDLNYYEAIEYYGKGKVTQLDVSSKKIDVILKEISLIISKSEYKKNLIDWISLLEKKDKLEYILEYMEKRK